MIVLRRQGVQCGQRLWQAAAHQVLLARRPLQCDSGARSSGAANRHAAGQLRPRPRSAASR
eukprot:6987297-Prymnesium_polylepis.1